MPPAKPSSVTGPPSGFGKPLEAPSGLYVLIGLVLIPAGAFLLTGTMNKMGVYVLPVFSIVALVVMLRNMRHRRAPGDEDDPRFHADREQPPSASSRQEAA